MNTHDDPFLAAYHGYLSNLLRWEDLDALWAALERTPDKRWYLYAIGETPPEAPAEHPALKKFIREVDTLLREEHDESYCGIVYVDDRESPTLIKIYDPNNLGSVCGSGSLPPPLPGWVLSLAPPVDLPALTPLPGNRRRW